MWGGGGEERDTTEKSKARRCPASSGTNAKHWSKIELGVCKRKSNKKQENVQHIKVQRHDHNAKQIPQKVGGKKKSTADRASF